MKKSCCRHRTSVAIYILTLLLAVSAEAATFTVTSAADAGGTCPGATCTLRQAIATAVSGDTINFAAGITTINLTSGTLFITNKALTISGPGANVLTVQRSNGAGNFRIISIALGANVGTLTISGLRIANGSDGIGGGGIYNQTVIGSSSLTVTGCVISDNSASTPGGNGNGGGAIYNNGMLTVTNSTLSGNSADRGGGISNIGTATITNSTLSGNSASQGGGSFNQTGTMTVTNSTIFGNRAVQGGGMYCVAGTINARNTIIAQNTVAAGGSFPDFSGELTSGGYNLIGNTSGTTITGDTTGNQLNVNPLLGPLQNNGGPTFTHALLSGSTAIEGGNSSGSNTDQRGLARPVDSPVISNATGGDGSDIGAYEVQADQLPGCNNINRVVNNNNDSGPDSLRAVIANVCAGSTVTFAPSVTGAIDLTSGELLLNKTVTINGPGANLLSVQRSAAGGTPVFRIFNITPNSVNATISGLTIANGNTSGNGGGISNTGALTIADCTISGHTAGSNGGGISSSRTLSIVNSTISGNSATGGFGGGVYSTGTAEITNSTISDNSVSESSLGIGSGGGIQNGGGVVSITNSTISGNTAQFRGGGINSNSTTLRSRNTIIALNTASSGPDVFGTLTSENFNLIGNNSGVTITPAQFSDQIGTPGSPINPQLGPLQNNGGPTLTRALLSGSPAIDKGHSSGSATDQRGFPRPVDFPAITNVTGGEGGDIGAFEAQGGLVSNVSTRLPVGTSDNVLIEGFIVQGPAGSAKKIIVRAIGPSLAPFGISDALANPTLEIHDANNATVATNDDWKTTQIGALITSDQSAEISTSGLAPGNDLESAIIANLAPGSYTAVVRGLGNTVGTGVVDAYDLSAASPARLANIATRGLIQAGDKLMIAGFIVQNGPVKAVIRAIGPSLSAFGITNALADTTLQLRDVNGVIVRENDNWKTDQKAELENIGLQPTDDLEAALAETIQPGQYTAQVRGKNDSSGIGVVQVYFLQ